MGKLAKAIKAENDRLDRGEATATLSPIGDRGEYRPGLRTVEQDLPAALAWEEAQELARTKTAISLRVPPHVLAFFKGSSPSGYQRRINLVLASYVSQHSPDKRTARGTNLKVAGAKNAVKKYRRPKRREAILG